mmetsp:Transcript_7299/g.25121  ORF Transcript_7299/g.25121 Transcript_7299/m.25121 type:complete len:204 (-) Transcript_7299:2146-2757(-)
MSFFSETPVFCSSMRCSLTKSSEAVMLPSVLPWGSSAKALRMAVFLAVSGSSANFGRQSMASALGMSAKIGTRNLASPVFLCKDWTALTSLGGSGPFSAMECSTSRSKISLPRGGPSTTESTAGEDAGISLASAATFWFMTLRWADEARANVLNSSCSRSCFLTHRAKSNPMCLETSVWDTPSPFAVSCRRALSAKFSMSPWR